MPEKVNWASPPKMPGQQKAAKADTCIAQAPLPRGINHLPPCPPTLPQAPLLSSSSPTETLTQ